MLEDRVATRKIALLTGARQTGKTTMVRDILPVESDLDIAYFNLDDPDERIRLHENPVSLLNLPGKLVVLDEIQKQPELLDVVKLITDRQVTPRFLLLGSSQILLLNKVRESLAGRITILSLWPLAVGERVHGKQAPEIVINQIMEEGEVTLTKLINSPPSPSAGQLLQERSHRGLVWGGFPPVETLPEDQQRRIWLRDYRSTYLERDLADVGRVADLDQFARAQILFAARTGQILSYSEVSRDLGVSVNTIKKYLKFLEISYQVHLLQPYSDNISSRLVKSPKIYWLDTGLARVLSERFNPGDGPLYETFIAGEIVKWLSWMEEPPKFGYFRTSAGAEVDFVIWTNETIIAIEAKASTNVHPGSARSIIHFFDSIPLEKKKTRQIGLIVYRGKTIRQMQPNVWAIPDWILFGGINMYLCSYKGSSRTSDALMDGVEYRFDFTLTPEEKIGQPDEKHSQKEVGVSVSCSRSQAAVWGFDHLSQDIRKILFWFAQEKIKKGEIKLGRQNEISWNEFPEEFRNMAPDVSRMQFPPPEPFLIQLEDRRKVGFQQ
ncbi:MAG: ATP-binding protein [Thermoleophilia bacterium]